jgi:outer membrane protein TolC
LKFARAEAAALGAAQAAYLPQIGVSASDMRIGGDTLASSVGQDGRSALSNLSWTLVDFGQ